MNSVVSCDGATERYQYLKTFLLDVNIKNESVRIYFCFCQIRIIFSIKINYCFKQSDKMNLLKCLFASSTYHVSIKTAFL